MGKTLKLFLSATLLYLIAFLVITLPLARQGATSFTGEIGGGELGPANLRGGDLGHTLLIYAEAQQELLTRFESIDTGSAPSIIKPWLKLKVILELPAGGSYQRWNILDLGLLLLWQRCCAFPLYYNLLFLTICLLNALAAFYFFRFLGLGTVLPWLGGLWWAFNPYVLGEVTQGRMVQALMAAIPLYLLYLFKFKDTGDYKAALLAGVWLSLTALSYWYYGMFAVLFSIIFLLYYFNSQGGNKTRFVLNYALHGLVFVLIITPALLPLLRSLDPASYPAGFTMGFPALESILEDEANRGNELLILGNSVMLRYWFDGNLTFILAWLAFIPLMLRRKLETFWLLSFGCFALLTLGPYLRWEGNYLHVFKWNIGLPYLWAYKFIPFFSRLYYPYRIQSFMLITGLVLVLKNLAWIKQELLEGRRLSFALFSFLVLLSYFVELLNQGDLPLSQVSLKAVPGFYARLAHQPEAGVIEVPMERSGDISNHISFYFFLHRRKVIGFDAGARQVEFLDPQSLPYSNITQAQLFTRNTFLRALAGYGLKPGRGLLYRPNDREYLKMLNFQYVVVHRNFFLLQDQAQGNANYVKLNQALSQTLGPPVFADYQLKVYRL